MPYLQPFRREQIVEEITKEEKSVPLDLGFKEGQTIKINLGVSVLMKMISIRQFEKSRCYNYYFRYYRLYFWKLSCFQR